MLAERLGLATVAPEMVRAVTLDFGGTLDGEEHWRERFWRFYQAVGLGPDRAEFERAFATATRAAYNEVALRGATLPELVRYHVEQQCQVLRLDAEVALELVVQRFVAESRAALQRHALLLRRWRERVRLGVISNFYGNLPVVLAMEGLAPLFDVVMDSTLVGTRKPERAIFELTCRALGFRPEEVVHVGDSLEHDVYGARNAGMKAAWLSSGEESGCDGLPPDVIRIDTLAALEGYLPWKPQ